MLLGRGGVPIGRRETLAAAILAGLALLLAGGALLYVTRPLPPGAHSSPALAVKGAVRALASGDLQKEADWIAPSERPAYLEGLSQSRALGITGLKVSIHSFSVGSTRYQLRDHSRALVSIQGSGQVCSTGRQTVCSAFPHGSPDGRANILTLREQGLWYIDSKADL